MKPKITLPLTSKLGDYSLYKMHGIDKMILRQNGGPTRAKYRRHVNYEGVRQNGKEFAGCSKMGSQIRTSLLMVDHLANFNYMNALVSIAKDLQWYDKVHQKGSRTIHLSDQRDIIKGFNLNKEHCFDTLITTTVVSSVDRENLLAKVKFPMLFPGRNFHNPKKLPMFRLIASMGIVVDMETAPTGYVPVTDKVRLSKLQQNTSWTPTDNKFPSFDVELQYPSDIIFDEHCTLLLSVGVEFGSIDKHGEINSVKYAGAAKVLDVG